MLKITSLEIERKWIDFYNNSVIYIRSLPFLLVFGVTCVEVEEFEFPPGVMIGFEG